MMGGKKGQHKLKALHWWLHWCSFMYATRLFNRDGRSGTRNGRKLSGWENPGSRKLSKRIYTGGTLLSSSPHSICCNTTPNANIGLRIPIANFHLTLSPQCQEMWRRRRRKRKRGRRKRGRRRKRKRGRRRNKEDNLSGSVAEHRVSPYSNISWSNLQTLESGVDCLTVLPHAGSRAAVGCGSVTKVREKNCWEINIEAGYRFWIYAWSYECYMTPGASDRYIAYTRGCSGNYP